MSTPTAFNTLISVEQLAQLQASGKPLMVFDCSFDLMNPPAGHEQYLQAHIPTAVFADLDKNLSAPHGSPDDKGQVATSNQAVSGGRHPLPTRERFSVWLSSIGFSNDMQAVVYDRNGANYCGRLWWMLRWAGHDAVAVLDGGLQAWQTAGQAVRSGEEAAHFQSNFELGQPLETLKTVIKRVQATTGLSIAEAAAELGVEDAWVSARVEDGTIRLTVDKWGSQEPRVTPPMMQRLRGALGKPEAQALEPQGWYGMGEAAADAGVSAATLVKWAEAGEVERRQVNGRWRYRRESLRARAERYWATCRFKRAPRPAWLIAG